jgi:signal transduction histidine kinase/DNA-binding response OmpR family regulator/ligand-binding sensor domain-containing protein
MALVDKPLLTIALIIFLFSSAILSFSQNDIRFKHFDNNSGLGWTGYFKLEQDSLGFIWAQGGEGLSRYDGYTWKNYLLDTIAKEKLSEFFIRELFKDANGNLWIVQPNRETGDVLLRYDYHLDRFTPIKPLLNGKGFPNMKVMVDKTDPIFWLSTKEGIYAFDLLTQKTSTFLEFPKDPKMAEALKILADIRQVKDGFLIATYKGVWLADKNKKKLVRPTCLPKDSTLLYHADVRKILYYSNDEVWLSLGREGVARLNGNYEVTLKQTGREMMWKYSFEKDAKGRCYLGSNYTGLHVYDPQVNSWHYLEHKEGKQETLKSNLVTDVLIDREQNLWVSLVNYGVSVSTKKEINFYNIPRDQFYGKPLGMLSVYPNSFAVLAKGNQDFLLHALKSLNKKNTLEINISPIDYTKPERLNFTTTTIKVPFDENVSVVYPGRKYLWVSFFNGGTVGIPFNYETQKVENKPLRVIELENGKEYPLEIAVMGCWEDPNENLWLGNEFGVYRIKFSPTVSTRFDVELFSNNPSDSLSLGGNPVSQFYVRDTTLWVLTYTKGVDKMVGYTATTPKFLHAFPHQSAASVLASSFNKVYIGSSRGFFESDLVQGFNFTRNLDVGNHGAAGITEDNLGRLWLSSELGVMFYDPKTRITNVFTDDHDYLYKDWYNIKTPNGWILSFDNEGLTLFNPEELNISKKNVKPVFTELQVNNKAPKIAGDTLADKDSFIIEKNISHLKKLTLDYLHNDFAVMFSTLEMIDPQKVKYQYKLEGYDKDWIYADWKNRQVHYTNLDHGEYTLRVRATNHYGIWSESEATLHVTILPPPWKSWWAYSVYALVALAILWFGRKFIIKQEQLRASLQLQQLELQKAQEVDKLKTTFFTNISHEFRTPLTLIKGPAQNLLEQTSGSFEKEQLKLIQRNADLLLKLINQLLELARLESGTIKIKNTSADINAFISTLAASFISLADNSQIDYTIQLPKRNFIVLTDFDKLETILINLLSNAFKFTKPNGAIQLNVDIQQVSHASILNVTIADTGIGIPQDVQSKIFDRFFQVNESHNQTGTGIGLALVKELTEMLKGEIAVQSSPVKGTTLTIKLPVEIQQEVTNTETQLSMIKMVDELPNLNQDDILAQIPKRATVLVVEDSDDLRKFIIQSLGSDYNFIEAANGVVGYEQSLDNMPDIIVSDVMMPELDGLQMTEKLKKDFRTSHIPVILLTANVTEESKLKGLGIGADDYLIKPFNKTELLLKVKNKIDQRAILKEKLKLELLTQPEKIETVSADEQFMLKVRKVILDNLGEEKLNVELVAEAVSLSRSQLFRKVNALTGSSVNELIRQFRLQRAAQLLEQKWAPVSQIAYEVGFSNLSYFSRCFKEQFGVLPSDYPKK